jgi:hypothetical protein
MTTAATKPRQIESPKYPGWTIERTGSAYLMTRPGHIFAIAVTHSEAHGWEGTLMTRQRDNWHPARTPYTFSVLGCTAEADRREKVIARYAARPLGRPLTK